MFIKTKVPIIFFVLLTSVSTPISAATFKGKVIDADTKEPIEGAVVVAEWREETTTPTATHSRLKDVKEILTDKKGEWVIKGPRGRRGGNITAIFTFLTGTYYTMPPQFIVFKPGYCSWPNRFGIEICKQRMRPFSVGQGETLELPKLTNREDRLKSLVGPVAGEGALEKQREFIRKINEERRNLGLKEAYY